jgi:two-component system, NarL family, sensor kinase
MKGTSLYDVRFLRGTLVLMLLVAGTECRAAKSTDELASVDSLKQKISQLVQSRKYAEVARSYDSLGRLYHQQYGYNKHSLDAYFKGLHYYGLLGDSLGYYNEYIVIGDYYTHDYFMQGTAEKYLTKARQYFERTRNMPKVIESRLGLANIAQKKDPLPDDLISQLRETEQLSAQYKQPQLQAYALNLLANTYSRVKMPDSAEYFANRSLKIASPLKINWLVALNHFYLGLVHQFRNESREAIDSYRKSFEIAESENDLSMLRELSRHTADSYSRLGEHEKAYQASLMTLDYANRFNTSEQTKSIRLQEYESQINTLAVEKQLVEEQNRTQRVVNSMLAVGLIISVLGVGALVFLRRQQKLIAHQETVIAQQQIRELELKSLRAMIEGQEGERSRIARDLHDGLGIQLSRIKLFVEAHQDQLPLSVKEPLNQFLDEACTETRLISSNLRPYSLSTFGFIPALEDLVQKLNLVNETKLILEHYGEVPPLGNEASVMIYRVVQELLNNALKHADAHTITVQVMASNETTLISVDDDGRGADFEYGPLTGNGIANINSRIAFLGGQVMWQSELGKGTSVMISLPMEKLIKPSMNTA